MPGIRREQGKKLETHIITRQDRNGFITDGGTWTWEDTGGTLGWSSTIRVHLGGLGTHTIGTGSLGGILATGAVVYVDLDRSSTGTLALAAGVLVASSTLDSDNRLVIGIRGADGKLYMRNGTVLSDGDSKQFGTLNTATDRDDVAASGIALYTIGFTYVTGGRQLAVYVGGILQTLGTHYSETSGTQVTFLAPYIPPSGELISFVNLTGGEGPPGGADGLQGAYDTGETIDVVSGTPVYPRSSGGSATTVVLKAGEAGDTGADEAFKLERNGKITLNQVRVRDNASTFWEMLHVSGDLLIHETASPYQGIYIRKADGALGFVTYPSGGPAVLGGALKWKTFSGSFGGVVAILTISAGLGAFTILGAHCVVTESGGGGKRNIASSGADASDATRRLAVSVNTSNDIVIAGDLAATLAPGTLYASQAYNLVVFYL